MYYIKLEMLAVCQEISCVLHRQISDMLFHDTICVCSHVYLFGACLPTLPWDSSLFGMISRRRIANFALVRSQTIFVQGGLGLKYVSI